ncbi:TonB-dependent receptor [Sphingomonas sp. Root710]|uniref:TonB-dependent receptor n=1 Tax=Sphingomonas sp. Root710 TaxID=1736594 RepID=UPI0006F97179|nr:TonB-dependent receptor [Sphingomonas sp. Root710]KRB82909.1 TonB-dependent receptor [Sphingomonas sp. Root710]
MIGFYKASLLGATILAGLAAPALAQDQAADSQDKVVAPDEIVVTATRRSVALKDAPINITAVTSDDLSRQRADDVRSLAALTPGVTVVDTGPSSTGNIILRGISAANSSSVSVSGASSNTSVGVYLGEVPLYLDFKLIDIDRVEVLQGPQGTLYGLGTLAGAVRYIPGRPNTNRLSVDLHGRTFAESHSKDIGLTGDATVNVPIVADHIAFRSVVGYYDNPGFIDYNYLLQQPGVSNPQPVRGPTAAQGSFGTPADYAANFKRGRDLNFEHTFTTRNTLLLQANPDIKAYLTYAYQKTNTDGRQANGAGVLGTGRYEGPWRYREPVNRDSSLYSAEVYINLGEVAQLVSTTAYTRQNIRTTRDNTDNLLDLNYGYEAFPAFSSYSNLDEDYKQFDQEIRLVSTHGGPFSWVVGAFYNKLKYAADYFEYTPGFAAFAGVNRPDDLEYITVVDNKTKEKAIYGELSYKLTDAWQVTGGLRYFKYDASVSGGADTPLFGGGIARTPYPSTAVDPSQIRSGDTRDDGMVWKLNTSYKFSSDLMAYFTYSTGYRVGGVNRVAPCVQPLPPGQNVCALPDELEFGPDKTRNMELGIRGALFDRRLRFTLSAFDIAWTDIQVPSRTVNGGVGITAAAGKAVSSGIEGSAALQVTPNLLLQGTYAYNDAHLTRDAPGLVVSQGTKFAAFDGDRLPGSTKNSGTLQATYTMPLGDDRSIEANWTALYTGNIYSRVGLRGNGEVIPGYVTHRASVTYRAKAFEVMLFADNIFDKYAVTAIGNDKSSFNQVRTNVVERYYALGVLTPRRVGVDVRFHY